jgi:hypothetical protein
MLDDARVVAEEYYRRVHKTERRRVAAATSEETPADESSDAGTDFEVPGMTSVSRLGDGRA